jgi:hypothetical protein
MFPSISKVPQYNCSPTNVRSAVEALSTPNERYFKYYEEGSVDSYSKAVADMDRYIELEGPFDAVLAFSQGSSVAAGFLMKTQSQGRVHFGCAIFIAGLVSPYDDSRVAAGAEKNAARGRDGGQRISMPTTHIWGASEENPAIPRELYERCVSEASSMLVFEGGHEVPGAKNNKALLDSTRLIRGMISLVQDGGMKDAT